MNLLSLIAALLLEQIQSLASRKYLSGWLSSYAHFFQHYFNAGQRGHGKIAWLLAALLPLCGTAALHGLVAAMLGSGVNCVCCATRRAAGWRRHSMRSPNNPAWA